MRLAIIMVAVFTLSACGGQQLRNPDDSRRGLAYGKIDVGNSDVMPTHVIIMRADKMVPYLGGGESTTITYTDGSFFAHNLEPGFYAVRGFLAGNTQFSLDDGFRGNLFSVKAHSVAYAGTYKVKYEKKGLFAKDLAAFHRVDSRASEAQLLRWLDQEVHGTKWQSMVRKRIAAAGQ